MRIMLALPLSPYPVNRGTGRLVMSLIEGLSARHKVTLVTMTYDKSDLDSLEELRSRSVDVRGIVLPHRRSLLNKVFYKALNMAKYACAGIPMEVSYSAPGEFIRLAADTAEEIDADITLASYWHLYRLPAKIRKGKKVLITHDVDYLMRRKEAALANRKMMRIAMPLDGILLEKVEVSAYRNYDTLLTVTESDADTLSSDPRLGGKKVLTLPHALDLGYFSSEGLSRKAGEILLLGTFLSRFNLDALSYFLEDVMPLVLADRPDASLKVVGHGVPERIVRDHGDRAEFTGYVEDIRPYLSECSLMVLPLRFAGGVRIRMLEAAAMGTPVVSTPEGVGGMRLVSGSEYIEASGARQMADSIIGLLGDQDLAARIGASARAWAETNISMEDYPDRLDKMLKAL